MIEYIAETEKAVKLYIAGDCYALDKYLPRKEVWVPKSQLSPNGIPGIWITGAKAEDAYGDRIARNSEIWWMDAKGEEFEAEGTEKEHAEAKARREAASQGLDYNLALVDFAKANGVKGIRKGLKTKTLESKIRAAGLEIPSREELAS